MHISASSLSQWACKALRSLRASQGKTLALAMLAGLLVDASRGDELGADPAPSATILGAPIDAPAQPTPPPVPPGKLPAERQPAVTPLPPVKPKLSPSPAEKSAPPKPMPDTATPPEPPRRRTFDDPTPESVQRAIAPEDFSALQSTLGLARGPSSAAPGMIGDFFGGGGSLATVPVYEYHKILNTRIINSTYVDTLPQVTPGLLGFAFDRIGPDPYLISAGPATLGSVGQQIPMALFQPFVTPTLNQPIPAGTSPFQTVNSTAYVTSNVPPGSPITGSLGVADVEYYTVKPTEIVLPSPGAGASVGSQKIVEGNSPMPRDRLFTFYDLFTAVPLSATGVNVNRMTPGFEKTFFDGLMSVDFRMPMALTLDSNVTADGVTNSSNPEFGNVALAVKSLLYRGPRWAVSTGLGMTLPSADDLNINSASGLELIHVHNKSVHLQPFLGALFTPNERFFAQSFIQVDVDTNGNPVFANLTGSSLDYIGRLQAPTFLYVSQGFGKWIYRSQDRNQKVTGVSLLAEVHLNRSLQTSDSLSTGGFNIGDGATAIEAINLTLGSTWELWNRNYLTTALITPLGGGSDRQFDGQFRLMFSRRFGPSTPQNSVQF